MTVQENDLPLEIIYEDNSLEVTYPEIPTFSPTMDDISYFEMISNGMVTSMKDATDATFQNEICEPLYARIIEKSVMNADEKRM